jgi:hypothetical protein
MRYGTDKITDEYRRRTMFLCVARLYPTRYFSTIVIQRLG